jgi:hypothetical protein
MIEKFKIIIQFLTSMDQYSPDLTGINITKQFTPEINDSVSIARNINAAFLITLSGKTHPLYGMGIEYLNSFENDPEWGKAADFYNQGHNLIDSEISQQCTGDKNFKTDLINLSKWIKDPASSENQNETVEKLRQVFFPEGLAICEQQNKKINDLRNKRNINISKLNASPIANPANEIIFTSNILITIPGSAERLDRSALSASLKHKLAKTMKEEQKYWYDHPVPIGVTPEHNEILYGLEGLDRAVDFEKRRGTLSKDARVVCVLSVSVTHEGLQQHAKEYLEQELKKEKSIRHLDVYVLTEADTTKMIENILIPVTENLLDKKDINQLYKIIGVDGEYGRHFSFLKAVAAFWQVLIDPKRKGSFKIDLDQVFPQEELVRQSGFSAFEHLKSPLWGAEGTDSDGNKVCLGMIAGALVNEGDIEQSLFTPDVCFPANEIRADELIFFSTIPQALSTEAEMMTRYGSSHLDGINRCIQRIHVTGGTCGILTEKLREYQPFTPSFIGRAEDQAYLLSVLFDTDKSRLRYVHKDGLIMRHDKKSFAGDAIKMAATGKLIGDYIRILMFSYYVRALPWNFNDIKDAIDPFTGCFVSRIPLTIVYLRFALKAATFFTEDDRQKNQQGLEFLKIGVRRLHETIQFLNKDTNPLIDQLRDEREGWSLFYHILDNVEKGLKTDDAFYLTLKEKAEDLINDCKINFE